MALKESIRDFSTSGTGEAGDMPGIGSACAERKGIRLDAQIRLPITTILILIAAYLNLFAVREAAAQDRPFLDPQFDFTVDTFQYGTGDVQVGGVDLGLPFPQKLLFLDLYKPVATPGGPSISTPAPAIILIHGGGFTTGTRNGRPYPFLGETFARLGYVCASIGYRKVPDDPPVAGATPLARAAHL